MRIMHVGKYYHPHRGGMETVLRELVEGLAARGVAVSAVVAGGDADRVETLPGGARLVRAWTCGVINSQPLTPTLPGLLRRELDLLAPDIVHLHLPNPLGAAAWLLASAGRGPKPLLVVWHHADITRQRLGRLAAAPVQQLCLGRAAGVAVSSRAHADGSTELAGHRTKVAVVPFGIDGRSWQAREASGDGPFVFVGRLVPYKGLAVLLQAMVEVPAARLCVVGDGPLRGELQELGGALGLADRIVWEGELPRDRLAERLSAARALVLPSLDRSETFGLVQLEAMAAGVPVIASDLPTGVREVAAPGSTHLLVPPGDSAALAAALATLAGDPELARTMGRAGRLRQASRFDRIAMLERLEAWYAGLLNESGG